MSTKTKADIKCPKCMGFLFLRNAIDGQYYSCLNCGFHKDIYSVRGVPRSPGMHSGAYYYKKSKQGTTN